MTFTCTHSIKNKLSILVRMILFINLIWSQYIILCFWIVQKHWLLRISFRFIQAIKLSWLRVCSVSFSLNFVVQWISSWWFISNLYFRGTFRIQTVTIENFASKINIFTQCMDAISTCNIGLSDFIFIIILQIIRVRLANSLSQRILCPLIENTWFISYKVIYFLENMLFSTDAFVQTG